MQPDRFNYYKHMSLSLLEGRLDITCPAGTHCHDLIAFNGKYYFYFGPVPAVVLIPAVLIWGENTPDRMIAALFGALNVFLLSGLFLQIRRSIAPSVAPRRLLAMQLRAEATREDWWYALLWGLGTVHFSMAMQGSVWYLAQIMAQTFLLLAARCILAEKQWRFWAAGIAFALACYTRNDLIFGVFFFLAVIWKKTENRKDFLKTTIVFLVPFFILSLLYLVYNYQRFGDFFESGFRFLKLEVESGLAERVAQFGKFSPSHLAENFYQQILKAPPWTRNFPFFTIDPHGFGMLWATPAYLLILPVIFDLYKRYKSSTLSSARDTIAMGCLISAVVMAAMIFMLPGHGYMQFAARYTLDFQLFLFLFLILHPGFYRPLTMWLFLVPSVFVNLAGAVLFTAYFHG